jgi:hypothetical protein
MRNVRYTDIETTTKTSTNTHRVSNTHDNHDRNRPAIPPQAARTAAARLGAGVPTATRRARHRARRQFESHVCRYALGNGQMLLRIFVAIAEQTNKKKKKKKKKRFSTFDVR